MKYGFILLNKNKFETKGHKSNLYGMIFNLSKKKFKNLVIFNYNNNTIVNQKSTKKISKLAP